MVRLDLGRVRDAVRSIDPVFLDTPQYEAGPLSGALGCSLVLKVETLNPVRSFKGRGTETVMSSLTRERRYSSAVCASAGNLGQALAYSGARRGIPVTVFAAQSASPLKINRMRSLGATVHVDGDDIERPRVLARAYADAEGGYLVEDSLDVDTPARARRRSVLSSLMQRCRSMSCWSRWAAARSPAGSDTSSASCRLAPR